MSPRVLAILSSMSYTPDPVTDVPHTAANWGAGCRCNHCRQRHNDENRQRRRRDVSDPALSPTVRTQLLRLLSSGVSPVAAARELGVTTQRMYTRRRYDAEWDEQMDDALMQGRDPEITHGTTVGYRYYRCRCPECRAAHHPPQR